MNCSNIGGGSGGNASSSSSSNKYKEEGNKLFMKRNYKEAIEAYTKALEKSISSTHYTNRALCYFKLQQWSTTIDDCRRAIELDPHSVKAYFFMGQSMCELFHFDEGIVHLKRAHELTKELNENYGDEITRTIRNAKRKRWNYLEEKRIKQEIELQVYLNRLMSEDKQKQINKIRSNSNRNDLDSIAIATSSATNTNKIESTTTTNNEKKLLDTDILKYSDENEKQLINNIENEFQQKFDELNRLFMENDARRRKREIPDFLCGKISFEIMNDPVITPSGITYDRNDIEQHLHKVGRFDPVTRTELTIDQLIPNLAIKEVVENFVNENEWIDGAI